MSKSPAEDSERVLRRKRQILREAARAFASRGFHQTGMREIAAALGMTAGSLYYYFDCKEELLAFCQEETARRLLDLAEWVAEQALPADVRLYSLIVGHVVCLHVGVPAALAHLELGLLDADRRRPVVEARDRYEQALRELIRSGREEGRLREDLDDKLAALAVLGALNGTALWFRSDGEQSAEQVGQEFARLLVGGLLCEGVTLHVPTLDLPALGELA